MNKERKVTSRPLAKKIHDKAKEKGFELPESEYSWILDNTNGENNLILSNNPFDVYECEVYNYYRAFDIAELGEMLRIERGSIVESYSNISENINYWTCKFIQGIQELRPHLEKHRYKSFHEESEAEARGKMLYYLLDNDLL